MKTLWMSLLWVSPSPGKGLTTTRRLEMMERLRGVFMINLRTPYCSTEVKTVISEMFSLTLGCFCFTSSHARLNSANKQKNIWVSVLNSSNQSNFPGIIIYQLKLFYTFRTIITFWCVCIFLTSNLETNIEYLKLGTDPRHQLIK